MTSVTVRRATVADADTAGRLLFDFNTEFDSPTPSADALGARFAVLLAREDVIVLLAEEGPITSGFALVTLRPTPYYDGPLAQLEELYVLPALRGSGIGTAMMGALLGLAEEHEVAEVHINVDEIDADTRRFYERHGFSNISPGEDYRMLLYSRELSH